MRTAPHNGGAATGQVTDRIQDGPDKAPPGLVHVSQALAELLDTLAAVRP